MPAKCNLINLKRCIDRRSTPPLSFRCPYGKISPDNYALQGTFVFHSPATLSTANKIYRAIAKLYLVQLFS